MPDNTECTKGDNSDPLITHSPFPMPENMNTLSCGLYIQKPESHFFGAYYYGVCLSSVI